MAKKAMEKGLARYFYPWPLVLVTCATEKGTPNIITIGASSVCSSAPPTVGIAVAPSRYSHQLILDTGEFGVNIPDRSQLHESDFCGTISGRNCDKFAEMGLTVMPSQEITVPLIAEGPVNLECRVVQNVPLGSHDWIIGEIVAAHVDENCLQGQHLDTGALDPIICYWQEYWSSGEKLENWHYVR